MTKTNENSYEEWPPKAAHSGHPSVQFSEAIPLPVRCDIFVISSGVVFLWFIHPVVGKVCEVSLKDIKGRSPEIPGGEAFHTSASARNHDPWQILIPNNDNKQVINSGVVWKLRGMLRTWFISDLDLFEYIVYEDKHYCDVTWECHGIWYHLQLNCLFNTLCRQPSKKVLKLCVRVSWHLISPATRLFVQQLVQATIKESIKALHYWPFVRGI